jgi:hypothetical protein
MSARLLAIYQRRDDVSTKGPTYAGRPMPIRDLLRLDAERFSARDEDVEAVMRGTSLNFWQRSLAGTIVPSAHSFRMIECT